MPSAFFRAGGEDYDKVGATTGLENTTCDRDTRAPEQVYVARAANPSDRPVVIDGWVGYHSIGWMRLTKRQTGDLISLLVKALLEAPE